MMGSQIALRLAHKVHKVTAFNRDRSKIEKLLTNGTANLKIAHQPKEIGDTCDIAIICVKDYQAVENVTFMTGGFLRRIKCVTTIVSRYQYYFSTHIVSNSLPIL